jgi:hypothetical protein
MINDELLDALHRFADTELDQWEAFTFGSAYGPVYVTISRQPDPDGRHYDQADDLDVTSEHFAAGRPVAELDDDDNVVLRWSDGTVERVDEPDAIERLRSTIDADPDRRAHVEQLKDQMRAEIELEVREDDLEDLLVAAEHEARGAVLDRSDREFLARVARAAHDEIRRLRGVRPSDDEVAKMRAHAGDWREFLPPNAPFMDPAPEYHVWRLTEYVLRLLEALGVDVADEWGDDDG